MNSSIKEVLESRGIAVKDEHLPMLQSRWQAIAHCSRESIYRKINR
ncbi:hypothetical protein [Natribacillus halophilus]|uniref:Uncharacterized protein n=1 Tax=Natribacillus halophilus TaxID=549003 RepID=A0A1G8KD62_9BACI|nr:hypothetical protein [Natribacillus halophilus]SDI41375.1 hypothetical protein SAMN04488123_10236 [Natribacillus halophilus]